MRLLLSYEEKLLGGLLGKVSLMISGDTCTARMFCSNKDLGLCASYHAATVEVIWLRKAE